jgi:Domain of unknown function (DUF5664)
MGEHPEMSTHHLKRRLAAEANAAAHAMAKKSNPKDLIGSTKLSMSLVPSTLTALAALAFLEGALKYGRYNWRIAGVRMCIYLDAIYRHTAKLQNGEWADPVTHVPHLASIIACAGIIEDARQCGKLVDDRPPALPGFSGTLDQEYVATVAHLKELFKGHNPRQFTIADDA